MEITDTFIPTAGTAGLLAMVTYFFLQVAMYGFLASFIFSLTVRDQLHSEQRSTFLLTALASAVAGLVYYQIQNHYVISLSELATITDSNDRQTSIREAYNAVGQYRYVSWFVTSPLLVIQLLSFLAVPWERIKRQYAGLLMAVLFMFLASYIGHQQLSFDNEIQTGPKLTWGLIALIDYVFIVFTLNRLWKDLGTQLPAIPQGTFRLSMFLLLSVWGVYLVGYFLTLLRLDFNWIHITFTLADIVGILVIGVIRYLTTIKPLKS
ncbi:bacteriorhodopsin [Spirosoma sp. BT702]|uniref:Bacteriorhodopsin n=1 Tax=Spirosoma profusum TaxID=2771354 RepID=A0A926XXW5_9BACT|nr:bacteriorhodopsin [Spirosoma profusum]MBD2702091.1 bacteriorhodopsin [Spirosoma profusum]